MTDVKINNEKLKEKSSKGRKLGFLITGLAILLFICVLGYGYYVLSTVNFHLAKTVTELQNQFAHTQTDLTTLKQNVSTLTENTQKSEMITKQQEKILSEWEAVKKGDVNKWQVTEARYVVRMAQDQLQFSHDTNRALVLLKEADEILKAANDPHIIELRKAIALDIANLQALSTIDVTSLYLKLITLNNQLNKLPLPQSPLGSKTNDKTPDVPEGLPWWKRGLEYTSNALNKIVIVHRNETGKLPFVFPDEKQFFYQNLHAQMENAMWSLLHRNNPIYQASLTRAIEWVKDYFVQDAPATKAVLQNLEELSKVNIDPPTITFTTTLQLLDEYLKADKSIQST